MHLSLIDKAFFLKKTEFFTSLDLDFLLILAEKAELMAFKSGDTIFPIYSETHRMYLIVEGEVIIENEQKIITLKKDDCFGDEALFNQKSHQYKAKCHKNSALLTLMRSHVLSLIEQSPSFACTLLEIYTRKLALRERL